MAPTTALTIGPIHTLTEDAVYALPARACRIFSNVALEISNVSDFATNDTIAANDSLPVAAAFVRSTTAAAIVRLVAA